MDFFASASPLSSITYGDAAKNAFAEAIAARFDARQNISAGALPVLSARLAKPRPVAKLSSSSISSGQSRFNRIKPLDVPKILKDPSGLLLLDIRQPSNHSEGHLPHTLALSVPSTLLKRPAFPLERIAQLLPNAAARTTFMSWKQCIRIVAYDEDSDETLVHALLDKFAREGFKGDLAFIEGGYGAVAAISASVPQETASRRAPHPNTISIISSERANTAANPFFEAVRQNVELTQGVGIRIPLRIAADTRARAETESLLPAWIKTIAQRSLPLTSESQSTPNSVNGHDLAESLALQFHRIELAEQRRLQGVLAHHAKASQKHTTTSSASTRDHPFSITAGVEKGTKNRYRHIWPFEHARVRLAAPPDPADDYVNASRINPLGTRRKYIATQGPLDTTFADFWMLVWEQNVHIIVMLTREIENAQIKCGRYWPSAAGNSSGSSSRTMNYGSINVSMLSEIPETPAHEAPMNGFFTSTATRNFDHETITRILEITHIPSGCSRRITHFQHVDWPDMDVPSSPSGILRLLRLVNDTRRLVAEDNEVDEGPVLLHCSAGVGRTGGFIAADAILDSLRRDVALSFLTPVLPDQKMDVDNEAGSDEDASTPLGSPLRPPVLPPLKLRPASATRAWADAVSNLSAEQLSRDSPVNARHHQTTDGTENHTIGLGPASSPESRNISAASIPQTMLGTSSIVTSPSSVATAESPFAFGPPPTGPTSPQPSAISLPPSSSLSGESRPSTSFTSIHSDVASPTPLSWPPETQKPAPSDPSDPPENSNDTSMDYVFPRHGSPELNLSELAEPVCSVIQDMREQRMSLCQSLRQYVFVHAIIVEGALHVIDEEKIKAGLLERPVLSTSQEDGQTGSKRGASPTELVKKDRQGSVALVKRPSVRRGTTVAGSLTLHVLDT